MDLAKETATYLQESNYDLEQQWEHSQADKARPGH